MSHRIDQNLCLLLLFSETENEIMALVKGKDSAKQLIWIVFNVLCAAGESVHLCSKSNIKLKKVEKDMLLNILYVFVLNWIL